MAAEPAPGFTAADLFGKAVADKWIAQSSSSTVNNSYFPVLLANGDNSCEAGPLDVTTTYQQEYLYCGSAIKTDSGTLLSAFGVTNAIHVDSITITWSNTSQPTMSITGHQHAVFLHTTGTENVYNWSAALTDDGGVGIGTLGTNYTFAEDAIPTGVTAITDQSLTFTTTHTDVLGSDGNHFAGIDTNGILTASVSGIGLYSEITVGSLWTEDDNDTSDSNTDLDTWSLTAHAYIART